MNARAEIQGGGADTVKLAIAVLLLVAAIFGFYQFAAYSLLLRVIALLVVAGVAAAIALQTALGRRLWQFGLDARTEVRKVVWPTRQDAMRITLAVTAFALIPGVFFWGLDLLLGWAARTLTGQGGA